MPMRSNRICTLFHNQRRLPTKLFRVSYIKMVAFLMAKDLKYMSDFKLFAWFPKTLHESLKKINKKYCFKKDKYTNFSLPSCDDKCLSQFCHLTNTFFWEVSYLSIHGKDDILSKSGEKKPCCLNKHARGCKDGSMIKSSVCSSVGPGFNS